MWQKPGLSWPSFFSLLMALSAACVAPDVGSLCPVPPFTGFPEQASAYCACVGRSGRSGERYYQVRSGHPVDVLLVVGNTPGMAAKQRTLAVLQDWSLLLHDSFFSLHIGVVSTDVGSWVAEGTPFPQSAGACDSFAGDDGVLQTTSCLDRTGQTPEAQAACAAVCPDRRFIINDGRRFIATGFGQSNVPPFMEVDLRTGNPYNRGPEYALRCLLPLGESGCTISSPLEAAKRALDGHRADNTGFRRPEADLFILFLTDRDDCSMQLARRAENDPATIRCDTPDLAASPRCFAPGPYRCIAADQQCDQPWNQSGSKSYCRKRPDSPLVPVESYLQFFSEIASPYGFSFINALVATPALGQGAQILALQPAGTTDVAALSLAPVCRSPNDPRLFGMPQQRLSAIRAPWSQLSGLPSQLTPPSICDPDQYSGLLPDLQTRIQLYLAPTCLPNKAKRIGEKPLCLVGYVPQDDPLALPDSYLPLCSGACCAGFARSATGKADDPAVIAACSADSNACFCVESSQNQVCHRGADHGDLVGIWVPLSATPTASTEFSIRCALDECSPP